MVGGTYQLGSPFGDEAPLQTVHYDRLRRYTLPAVVPLAGPPRALFGNSQPAALQGDMVSSGGPAGLSSADVNMDCVLEPSSESLGSPEQAVAPPRFSQAGRPTLPPARFVDYVMDCFRCTCSCFSKCS